MLAKMIFLSKIRTLLKHWCHLLIMGNLVTGSLVNDGGTYVFENFLIFCNVAKM